MKDFVKDDQMLCNIYPDYKNNHVVFPLIENNYWQCSCGRIHTIDDINCDCGLNLSVIKEIAFFDFCGAYAKEYFKNGIEYDYSISFDKNIENCKDKFSKLHGYNLENIEDFIDIADEKIAFDEKIEILDKEKKNRKKRNTIICVIILALIALVATFFVTKPEYFKYIECLGEKDLFTGSNCFCEITVLDSEQRGNNLYKEYITNIYENGEYEKFVNEVYINGINKKRIINSEDTYDYTILDEDVSEMFLKSLEIYTKENKNDVGKLHHIDFIAKKFTNIPDDFVDDEFYGYYSRSVTSGSSDVTKYFLNSYKESGNRKDYVNYLKSIHYEISVAGQDYKDSASFEKGSFSYGIISSNGFESFNQYYNELKSALANDSFYDSIINDQCYDKVRLKGYWSGNGYYFELKSDGHISYNIPWVDYGDYYNLYNHYITLYEEGNDYGRNLFGINFISDTEIEIESWKNFKTYKLYKQ